MAKINGINVAQPKSRGTGSADIAFSVLPPTGSASLFRVSGDGTTTVSGSLVASSITSSLQGTASFAVPTDLSTTNLIVDIDPLIETQSVESAHELAKAHYEELGYEVVIDL
jgi:hypothetical protein